MNARGKQLPAHPFPSSPPACVGGFLNPLCFLSGSALKEFELVPRHLTDELCLFSLEDLVRVKKGLLVPSLKDILNAALAHVAGCEVRSQGAGVSLSCLWCIRACARCSTLYII